MQDQTIWASQGGQRFTDRSAHRHWLLSQAMSLLEFHQYGAFNPAGGFFALDGAGRALAQDHGSNGVVRHLHDTTRMVHCYAIANCLGLPDAERNIDHGLDFLWTRHRDTRNGGYFNAVDDGNATDASKQAYGHGFVLLAAASAKIAGHPDADRLLDDVSTVLQDRFWDAEFGAAREEFGAGWQAISNYRGQNSNMHLCEASMATFEATGDRQYLEMAEQIAGLIINRHAAGLGWRVAEHFDDTWQVDRAYAGNPMFRPRGTTPGHALEWARLLVQLWQLGGRRHDWMKPAARNLFFAATGPGWDSQAGGFFYTLDWDDAPDQTDKYWWPCAEGIGAAVALASVDDDPVFEKWYRRIWGYVNRNFIDHENGGWWPDIHTRSGQVGGVFIGKPDIYHALQACLIPLLPSDCSVTAGIGRGRIDRSGGARM